MSEPMSNHEIEDVLSSIRRLVSEDLRPTAKTDGPPPQAQHPLSSGAAPNPAREKLILTPAFRVVTDEAEADAPAPQADDLETDDLSSLDDSEIAGFADPEEIRVAEDPVPVQSVVSRLSAAVGESDEEWESPVGDPLAWQAETPEILSPATSGRLHFQPMADDQDDPAAAFNYEPDAFSVERDFDDSLDTPDPAASAPREVSPPADDWADAAEAEVRAELEQDVVEDTTSLFSGQEVTFDEEVLRDLVRDIIREELAGTLGERITRNVRKLVRSEIARALAVREFE